MRRFVAGSRFILAHRWIAAAPVVLAALILLLDTPTFAQCAMCQGASAAGSDGGAVYNRSTLFMLAVPYLLLAGVAGYVVYAFRRVRPAISAADPMTAPPGATAASDDSERSRG